MAIGASDLRTAVSPSYGDELIERLCVECERLRIGREAVDHQLASREAEILSEMLSRDLGRVDLPAVHIRRSGRTGISVTILTPWPDATTTATLPCRDALIQRLCFDFERLKVGREEIVHQISIRHAEIVATCALHAKAA